MFMPYRQRGESGEAEEPDNHAQSLPHPPPRSNGVSPPERDLPGPPREVPAAPGTQPPWVEALL